MDERDDTIRRRAYELWLAAGSPEGSPEQYWLMAEQELFGDKQPPADDKSDDSGLDEALSESFPASDPPAGTQP